MIYDARKQQAIGVRRTAEQQIKATAPDKKYVVYQFRGGQIQGEWFHATGAKMSDGQFWVKYSWTHGDVTRDNWKTIAKEDAKKRRLRVGR